MTAAVHDQFDDVFGERRGHAGQDGALTVPGAAAVARARTLLSLIAADALAEPLTALAAAGEVPGAQDAERAYAWPPEDVADRARQRASDRSWTRSVPADEDDELAIDAADTVRRTVAERVAGQALTAWTPVFREMSHAVGLRRHDMADHVVRIGDTLHLFDPANVLLAGDRGYMQSMGCGESAYQPAADGLLTPVARGLWAQTHALPRDKRPLTLCPKCLISYSRHGFDEARTETADGWLALPSGWEWLAPNTTARVHQHLARHPDSSERALREVANATARERYLGCIPTPAQQDDKPCLWYRAPGLTDEERYEVSRRTYDRRIFNTPLAALLDAQCPATPVGFIADDAWRRKWCERLLVHLRSAAEHARA